MWMDFGEDPSAVPGEDMSGHPGADLRDDPGGGPGEDPSGDPREHPQKKYIRIAGEIQDFLGNLRFSRTSGFPLKSRLS